MFVLDGHSVFPPVLEQVTQSAKEIIQQPLTQSSVQAWADTMDQTFGKEMDGGIVFQFISVECPTNNNVSRGCII